MPHYLPNYSQEEVKRQNSTSSALSFLRWGGDESLRDGRKKAAKCVAPQLSVSLWRPKHFIYSSSEQNLSPLVIENQIEQPNAGMHATHTIWVHSFPCTSAQSQKTQSYPINDYCQGITEAEHPHSCFSVYFVRNRIKDKNQAFKMGPRPKLCVRQGQKWALHVDKQLMQMMFSNNSIQAALAGERKRMLLIAREHAGGQMGRLVHSMLPFRNYAWYQGTGSRRNDNKRHCTVDVYLLSQMCKSYSLAERCVSCSKFLYITE